MRIILVTLLLFLGSGPVALIGNERLGAEYGALMIGVPIVMFSAGSSRRAASEWSWWKPARRRWFSWPSNRRPADETPARLDRDLARDRRAVLAPAHLGGVVPRAAHTGPDQPLGAARRGVLLLA